MHPTTSRLTPSFLRLANHQPFHRGFFPSSKPHPVVSSLNPSSSIIPHENSIKSRRAFTSPSRLQAQESYGSSSNPAPSPNTKGSPSESHPSSEHTQKMEHPGPESPAAAGGGKAGGAGAAQPKILSEQQQSDKKGGAGGEEDGVKKHNEEM